MESVCRRFSLRFCRYNRNALTSTSRPRRRFPVLVAAPRLHQTANQGQRRRPFRRARRLPGVSPGALETHTFPAPALQNHQLTLRRAGSFARSSTPGQRERRSPAGCQVPVEDHLASLVEDAQVHRPGVQIDTAVKRMLSVLKSHHGLPDRWRPWCALQFRPRPAHYRIFTVGSVAPVIFRGSHP